MMRAAVRLTFYATATSLGESRPLHHLNAHSFDERWNIVYCQKLIFNVFVAFF